MLEAISLASGSDGNCLLVRTKKTRILIDAGISPADIIRKLKHLDVDPRMINALLISHEHNDHSRAVFDLAKRFKIPAYANQATLKELNNKLNSAEVNAIVFQTSDQFRIGDLTVRTFPVYHDACEPVGFSIRYRKWKIVYLVDLVKVTEENQEEINTSNLVIIDSNYDRLSLMQGKYPHGLKKRIVNYAHLSNDIVGNLILNHSNKENAEFWLAHLSEENNSPKIACISINYILKQASEPPIKANFKVLPRNCIGPRWIVPEEEQMVLPLAGITLPADLSNYRASLKEDKIIHFDQNFQRAQEILLSDIQIVYVSPKDNGTGWKIIGIQSESYVVARDIAVVGIEGVQIANKIWTCECGDFLYRCQKHGLPCKHIIRVVQWLGSLT